MAVHVFCGPSITARDVERILPGALTHPPIRHGDLLALDCRIGDEVLIIDGLFHTTAPVRHKEILHLLDAGVMVAGAASMGALRAAELHSYGMRGIGRVFDMYRSGVIDGDDEVAVVHTPDDALPLSIALVDVRDFLKKAAQIGMIRQLDSDQILKIAKSIPYQMRSKAYLIKSVEEGEGISKEVFAWWSGQDGLSSCRSLKQRDAVEAVTLLASGKLAAPEEFSWDSSSWRTPQLGEWIARSEVKTVGTRRIPAALEIQHQRLYDPNFPSRWRECILAWISGEKGHKGPDFIEYRALEVARISGLTLESLADDQINYWLTGSEREALDDKEKMLRLLVRSALSETLGSADFADVAESIGLLNPELDTISAALSAWRVNEEIERLAPHRSIYRLKSDLLAAHLADQWGVRTCDIGAFDAAARDRGFRGKDGAVEASRSFYLHVSGVLGDQFNG